MSGKWYKVRKKPVVVLAMQLEKDTAIDTLEGRMQAKAGDWLIKGVKGELYPVRRDIFEETYEIISE
jgi:hypothetical protein